MTGARRLLCSSSPQSFKACLRGAGFWGVSLLGSVVLVYNFGTRKQDVKRGEWHSTKRCCRADKAKGMCSAYAALCLKLRHCTKYTCTRVVGFNVVVWL